MSWVLVLSLILCAVSFLPAIFDHGERKKAFKAAISGREKWEAGLKWIAVNWGLPILTIAVTAGQAVESFSLDNKLKSHELTINNQSNRIVSAEKQLTNTTVQLSEAQSKVSKLETKAIQQKTEMTNIRNKTEGLPKSRILSTNSQQRILEKLRMCRPVSVRICLTDGSGDSKKLAIQIGTMFVQSGFLHSQVSGTMINLLGDEIAGVKIVVRNDTEPMLIDAMQQLFIEIGQAPQVSTNSVAAIPNALYGISGEERLAIFISQASQ